MSEPKKGKNVDFKGYGVSYDGVPIMPLRPVTTDTNHNIKYNNDDNHMWFIHT